MKTFATLTALLAAANAAVIKTRQDTSSPAISLTFYNTDSSMNNLAINAGGNKFFVGGAPDSYCPLNATQCEPYPGNETWVSVTGGALNMDVVAPGGQNAYVAADGSLSFTTAHEEGIFPNGSYTTGFGYYPPAPGGGLSSLTFANGGATSFVACPSTTSSYWQVFVNLAGLDWDACTPFVPLATSHEDAANPNAFEYD